MQALIERVQNETKLWNILLGFCPAPNEYQFGLWARQFRDDELETAFTRASKKFGPHKGECPDAHNVHRYVTGILVNRRKEAQSN